MSWSVNKTGTPEEVIKYLLEQSETLQDQSKREYDSALPHLVALVSENKGGSITISAEGHGVLDGSGQWQSKYCTVNIG